MTPQQNQVLKLLINAIIDTVRAAGPLGAPAGPMYAALMAHGCSLEQFESLMSTLVRLGAVTKLGDCYHVR